MVCKSCIGVSYNCLEKFGERAMKYVIYANAHKVKNHRCTVIQYTIKMGKIYTHVMPKYSNCKENYSAIVFKYPTYQRV